MRLVYVSQDVIYINRNKICSESVGSVKGKTVHILKELKEFDVVVIEGLYIVGNNNKRTKTL